MEIWTQAAFIGFDLQGLLLVSKDTVTSQLLEVSLLIAITFPRSAFTIIYTIVNIPGPFLIKIDLNIISSLHIVFSLFAQVGWCDVHTDFMKVVKVDVDVNEKSLLNI